MRFQRVSNLIGLGLLFISSMTFLGWVNDSTINFALAIGIVLLIFAWTDYFKLLINVLFGFAAIVGFFIGNIEGVFYALPTGVLFILFAYLNDRNRERAATAVFLFALPVALINSYYFHEGGPIAWALVGLMIGIIENAVVENMAEGDVFIIALYFMALGPLAFIPLALEGILGITLYTREIEIFDDYVYPLGPAMFITSVPLFYAIPELVRNGWLPSWLFYAHAHGVPHPGYAMVFGVLGAVVIGYMLNGLEEDDSPVGLLMAGVSALIAAMLTFGGVGLLGVYLQDHGYEHLTTIAGIGAIVLPFVVGAYVMVYTFNLHYEGRSSINSDLWKLGIRAVGVALSAITLPGVWKLFAETHKTALALALFLPLWFLLKLEREELKALGPVWTLFYLLMNVLAGVWIGLGMGWILQ